jgi:hypothetical protein
MYSSTGPEIKNVEWGERAVVVETSSVASVIVQGSGSAATAVHGTSMTKTTVALDRFSSSKWLRVTVIDHAGQRAWTNPVWR